MHRVFLNVKGPLVEAAGCYRSILVVVDQFTGYTCLEERAYGLGDIDKCAILTIGLWYVIYYATY